MEKARGRTLGPGRVDRAKIKATTEHDTRRHLVEDGLDPDNPLAGFRPLTAAAEVRRRAEMSQDAFAKALRVPVKTIRNWEQRRSRPNPAVQALLAIVADDPTRAFEAIGRNVRPISTYAVASSKGYPKVAGQLEHESQAVRAKTDAMGATVARDLDPTFKDL